MAAYRGVRERTAAMLADIDDASAAATVVPCCPGWTVAEVVGHLCGVADDVLAGRLEGVGTAPWADAQAARLAPLGLQAVLARWDELGPQLEAIGAGLPSPARHPDGVRRHHPRARPPRRAGSARRP